MLPWFRSGIQLRAALAQPLTARAPAPSRHAFSKQAVYHNRRPRWPIPPAYATPVGAEAAGTLPGAVKLANGTRERVVGEGIHRYPAHPFTFGYVSRLMRLRHILRKDKRSQFHSKRKT